MDNLIDWITLTLSKDGINSKELVRSTLDEMTIDDWYVLKYEAQRKIISLKEQGHQPESNANVMMLQGYQYNLHQCEVLQKEIDILASFVKAQGISDMPSAPYKEANPVEAQHIRLIDAKHKLEKLLATRGADLAKCLELINQVTNTKGRYILTSIFIENKTLYQILESAPFDISYRQIIRLKKAALEEIRKM